MLGGVDGNCSATPKVFRRDAVRLFVVLLEKIHALPNMVAVFFLSFSFWSLVVRLIMLAIFTTSFRPFCTSGLSSLW